jgi:ribosomal-protein-serine acetyltransferase
MIEFPEIIKDGDIELRRPAATFDTARMIFEAVDRNREYLGEFLTWPEYVRVPEDQFKWVVGVATESKKEWLIYVDDKYAGTAGFVKAYQEPSKKWVEIGYWIDSKFAGRGIMTRVVKMLENMVFETGEFDRIQIGCDELNQASWRVAEKAGYKLEGTLRSYDKMGVKASGDIRMYSKIKSEWKK